MQPLALVVLGISGPPQPVPLASERITLVKISMELANRLQPLQHGVPCETHI